jgi:hypothetical protein
LFYFQDDGTTQTNSFLAFTATEHDNGRKFSCAAVNSVMLKEGSKPMKEIVIIEVMCECESTIIFSPLSSSLSSPRSVSRSAIVLREKAARSR